ncbi:MAG: hypothetical protein HW416_407 [Chloroflexi bacterium]|nr:hypothetical protein [Chloroflexota bacterium]
MKAQYILIGLLLAAGCAQPRPSADTTGPATAPTERTTKTITLGVLDGVKAYGHLEYPGGGLASLSELLSNALVTDGNGGLEPRLASKLPSFDDGSIVLLPDGRMRTTWNLRPNVFWHDGAPFTAGDIAFAAEVRRDPELPSPDGGNAFRFFEQVDTPDPLTAVITWKTTYFKPLDLPLSELWPYPRHLLEDTYRVDKVAYRNLPYFTSDYVHLGAFRLVDWGMGETQVLERFDRYFLGAPRVDRIVIRAIPDTNTLLANLKSGAIDIAPEKTLPTDLALNLRNEWQQSGEGMVTQRQENWRYMLAQMNTEWGRPPDVGSDIRLRRGLYTGIDRDALRELALPGIPDTEADSFMPKNDPRAPIVGKPFARYRYDPAAASRDLADAGWQSAGGRLVSNGEQVQLAIRGSPTDQKEVSVIAQYWRSLGIEVVEEAVPPARQQDREYRAKFSGFEMQSREPGDKIVANFDSRRRPTAENGYVGSNPTSYVNPVIDRLVDRLSGTLDRQEQGLMLKEMGDILASDLPVLPTYFRVQLAAVVKGVRALDDYPNTIQARGLARNAHLWDRQ